MNFFFAFFASVRSSHFSTAFSSPVLHMLVSFFAAACAESFNIQARKNKSITKEKRILVALLSVLFYCCGTAEWKSAHNTQEVARNVKILIRMLASNTAFWLSSCLCTRNNTICLLGARLKRLNTQCECLKVLWRSHTKHQIFLA